MAWLDTIRKHEYWVLTPSLPSLPQSTCVFPILRTRLAFYDHGEKSTRVTRAQALRKALPPGLGWFSSTYEGFYVDTTHGTATCLDAVNAGLICYDFDFVDRAF